MPRKRFLPSEIYPYHVTARCTNKEWFQLPLETVWDIFSNYLYFTHHAFNLKIHNFVLMNNHFHMIATTPDANLDEIMNYFLREVSKVIGFETNRINQIFGGPYHWSLIKDNFYYQHAYKYVYRNPVEANLAQHVELYPYSTLFGLTGRQHLIIPVQEDTLLFSDFKKTLTWLNTPYSNENKKRDISKALKRREFEFALDKYGRENILSSQIE